MIFWIASHWASIASVSAALVFVWRAGRFFTWVITSTTQFFADLKQGLELIKQVNSTSTLLATNHLPHLQAEMEKTNAMLPTIHQEMVRTTEQAVGLRDDFRLLTGALLSRREKE
jgi:hypothetical protein